MVAALFKAPAALSAFHGQRIALCTVRADKAVAQAVKAVGGEAAGEELIAVLFIVEVMLDDPLLIPAACGIQAHLEVAVVHIYMMEAEFQIGIHRERPRPVAAVAQPYVPDLHRVVHGYKERLRGVYTAVVTEIFHVTQSVPAGVVLLRLADGLPGDRPVIAVFLIPEVDIVPGEVHRHPIRAEAGNPVIFGAFVQQISAGCVVEYAQHVLKADIIRPGYRQINPVYYIFPCGIVKMAVLHGRKPPALISDLYGYYIKKHGRIKEPKMVLFVCRCFS